MQRLVRYRGWRSGLSHLQPPGDPAVSDIESTEHLALRALVGVLAIVAALVAALASIPIAAQTVLAIVSLVAAGVSVRWMVIG